MYSLGKSTTPNLPNYHTHICRLNTWKIEQTSRSDGPEENLETHPWKPINNCHDDRLTGSSNPWIMFRQTNLPIFPFRRLGGMASEDEYSGRSLVEYGKKSTVG